MDIILSRVILIIMKTTIQQRIHLTLQLVICVLIGQEIAIPPNPYTNHLILALTVYICLIYDIPTKIIDKLSQLYHMIEVKHEK